MNPGYYAVIAALSLASALLTWELNVKRGWGGVKASSLVSLISGLIVYFLRINPDYGAAVMGASFAAMSTDKVIPNRRWVSICGLVFAALFLGISSQAFGGFGGRLGTTSCMSVVMTLGLLRVFGSHKKYPHLLHHKAPEKKIFK
ncbi:hypothetical protein FJZ53_05360 [Candidatus Woesearchaeota archaeon]|nr:hypothetical protein [Candidatus Woesearchaeota archaeon]